MNDAARSQPPDLPNFRHVGYLGGGGFADVFLYEQLRPSRQVAIKVLRNTSMDVGAQRSFDAEADLMARVSEHPYIVSIYGADVAPDGRPFLVMEYYPRPHFGQRARQGKMPVPEVLQVGVRLASAVETAHRAGILHRDIKPANVLVSQYGRPGLTDFGIAGGSEASSESQGVSVPYAAPEVVSDQTPGDERSDVYSLAATIYTMLAARSPFEVPNGDNSVHALARRVLSAPLPPIERDDVPVSLSFLLAQALAKDPGQRPRSAADLGRAFQGIERELGHAPTEFEIADDPTTPVRTEQPSTEDDDGTRASRLQVVRQQPDDATEQRAAAGQVTGVPATGRTSHEPAERERLPVPTAPEEPDTVARTAAQAADPDSHPPTSSDERTSTLPKKTLVLGAAGVILVALVGVVFAMSGGGSGDEVGATSTTQLVDENALAVPDTPPAPDDVEVTVVGTTATVRWTPADGAEPDDSYLVVRTDAAAAPVAAEETEATFDVEAGASPCFEVSTQRGSRVSLQAAEGCVSE